MKKTTSMIGSIIFLFLITSCNHKDVEDISTDRTQQAKETKNQHIESQEIIETDSLSWLEITEDGVNEDGKKITSSFRIVAMRKTRKDRVIIS